MNRIVRQESWAAVSRVAVLAGALTLVVAAAAPASTTSDAWITTKVKTSLLTTEGVSSNAINVDTVSQKVTLHGTVNSAEEKAAAESAAKQVQGVESVRNLLQVVPAKREAKVAKSDSEIDRQVKAALSREGSLRDSSISVASVNKGVVLLSGNAKTMSDQLTAVQVARDVPGVRRVASEIKSPEALASNETWREERTSNEDRGVVGTTRHAAHETADTVKGAAHETADTVKHAASSTTGAARDLYVTSMVKTRLLADKDTPAMDINVDTSKGIVTLFGEVPSRESKAAAESDAKRVSGVKSVRNELQVVASAKREAVTAKDDEIRKDVTKNLETRQDLHGVTADVKNCVVRLTGTVPSGEDRVEAMQVARSTRGVCAVENELRYESY